jgi:hypothetical protein
LHLGDVSADSLQNVGGGLCLEHELKLVLDRTSVNSQQCDLCAVVRNQW